MKNIDTATVKGFGDEWQTFSHDDIDLEKFREQFDRYFSLLDSTVLNKKACGFDLGCGSGRWAWFVAPHVAELNCVDASNEALAVAKQNLKDVDNCHFHHSSVDELPFDDESMDFAYSLGVLHHVPDTAAGIKACVQKLKPGGAFLIYLYYAFDNRPAWFRLIWKCSDLLRKGISQLPYKVRLLLTQIIAALVYWPLATLAGCLEKFGLNVENLPLSAYRHLPFYAMRTDALDRFGTQLEQRFTRKEISQMLEAAGLEQIRFNDSQPYWCAVAIKSQAN